MHFSSNGNYRTANDDLPAQSRVTYVSGTTRWVQTVSIAVVILVLVLGAVFLLLNPAEAMERCQRADHSFDTCAETLW